MTALDDLLHRVETGTTTVKDARVLRAILGYWAEWEAGEYNRTFEECWRDMLLFWPEQQPEPAP